MSVHVGGDVRGQLVVGDHNVTVTGSHSTVTIVRPGEQPRPVRREQCELLPRRTGRLVGRQRELKLVLDAIAGATVGATAGGEPVQVLGQPGVGRSALLRQAAHDLAGFGDGVVFLDAAGRDTDDVVQDIFEACYDTAGYRPGVVALRRFMAGIRVCLVIDDLDCPADRLPQLLDALPDAAILFTAPRRLLWGQGTTIELDGLPEQDSDALLATILGRPLRPDELGAAHTLWQTTRGNPRQLRRAVAGRTDLSGSGPADLAAADRECLALLAIAAPGGVSVAVLDALGFPPGTADRLVALGLVTATERGYRPAGGKEQVRLDTRRLAELAALLTEHLPTAGPGTVADHGPLVAGLVDALTRAGRPELGTRLARAVAPAAACSLRWGAWRRILGRGHAAAERAGDRRAQAYFAHEEGVRRLLTGRRLAAAAAFAAAATIWHELGDTGPATEHADSHATPPNDTEPPEFDIDHPDGPPQEPVSPPDSMWPPDPPSPPDGGAPADLPPEPWSPPPPPPSRLPVGVGGIITAVLTFGFVALGSIMVGDKVFGGPDRVTLRLRVMTNMMQVGMPEVTEQPCRSSQAGTFCTGVLEVAKDATEDVVIRPNGTLPANVRVLYYGCLGRSPTTDCRVKADEDKTICITTSDGRDASQQARCADVTAGQGTGDPGDGGPTDGGAKPLVHLTVIGLSFNYQVSVGAGGGEPVLCKTEGNQCHFDLPAGEPVALTAVFDPQADHLWFGCEGSEPTGAAECTVNLTAPRTVCVAARVEPGGTSSCARYSLPG